MRIKWPKPGKYTNRKGKQFTLGPNFRDSVALAELFKERVFPADTTPHMKPAVWEAMMQDSAINESKEYPPVTEFLTADEIVRQYGET